MSVAVTYGDPRDAGAIRLLQGSHDLMTSLFPVGECHFLSIDALCGEDIRFFVAKDGNETLGCAALAIRDGYGEVKSMFVDPAARGRSVGAALLTQVEDEARGLGLPVLNLETGTLLHAAHRLYERGGFTRCGPFGDYDDGEFSIFMTKAL